MLHRTAILFVVLLPLISRGQTQPASTPEKVRSVHIDQGGKRIFEYQFKRPQEILKQDLSPSGHYLFVWHRDRPPIRLTIFRVKDSAMLGDFAPGFGGELQWTLGDKILHAWGCGTNCQTVRVYDITGATLREEMVSGLLLSDRGFYIAFSSIAADTHAVTRYDVNTGRETTLVPARSEPPEDVRIDGKELAVTFPQSKAVRVKLE